MPQVLFDERRDEVVTMVVAFVRSQRERLPRRVACLDEALRPEGAGAVEERVARPLIDEDRAFARARAQERSHRARPTSYNPPRDSS